MICIHNIKIKKIKQYLIKTQRLWGVIENDYILHYFFFYSRTEIHHHQQQHTHSLSLFLWTLQVISFPVHSCLSFFFVFLSFLFSWFLKYSSDWFLCLLAQVLNNESNSKATTKVKTNDIENREQHTGQDRSLQYCIADSIFRA